MPYVLALIIGGFLAAGLYVGPAIVPDKTDRTAPWWQTGRSRITLVLVGTIIAVEDGAFLMREHPEGRAIRITYTSDTIMLARPERVVAGHIDGIRLLVVPPEEILRPGALVGIAARVTETEGAPYAFSVSAIPL